MCGPSLSLAGREAERSWTGWVNTCIGRDYLLLPANICSPEPIQQMPVRHSALRMQSHALWQLHKSCSDQRLQDPFMASSHGLGNQMGAACRGSGPQAQGPFTHRGGAGGSDAGNNAGNMGASPGLGRAGPRNISPAMTPLGSPGTATSRTVRDRAASALWAEPRPTSRSSRAGSARMGFSASTQPRVSPLPTREMKTQDSKAVGGFKQQGGTSEQKVLAKNCEALGITALSHLGHMHIDLDPSL